MALFSTEFEYSSGALGTVSNLPTENMLSLNGPSGLKGRGQWISSWNHLGKSHQIILQHNYKWIPFYARTYSKGEYAMANIMMPMIYINILQRCGYARLFCNPGLQCLVNMPAILDSQAHLSYRLMSTNKPPAMVSKKTVTLLWISWSKEFWEIIPWPQQMCTELAEKKGWYCHICICQICQLHSFLFMPRSRNFRLSRLFKPEENLQYNLELL